MSSRELFETLEAELGNISSVLSAMRSRNRETGRETLREDEAIALQQHFGSGNAAAVELVRRVKTQA